MKRYGASRISAIRSGRLSISSRWISTSLSSPSLAPTASMRGVDRRVHGLDQRRFAHAARAPEQRVVGGQPAREALGVLHQHVAHAIDAFEQRHLDAIDFRDRHQLPPVRMPGEGVRRRKARGGRRRRREPFERGGDALENSSEPPGSVDIRRREEAFDGGFLTRLAMGCDRLRRTHSECPGAAQDRPGNRIEKGPIPAGFQRQSTLQLGHWPL